MVEIWATIKENPRYAVSNLGNVKNVLTGKMLKPRPTHTGYLRVQVTTERGRTDLYVHRLVADAFCEHPDGCNVVNHKDYNNQNNKAENLEWTTQKDNFLYSLRNGRMKKFPLETPVSCTKDGVTITYCSTREASISIGCDHKTVIRSCKTGRPSTNGYIWKRV